MPDLNHYCIRMFYNNTLTIVWENILASKHYMKTGRILHVLALRKRRAQVSSLLIFFIAWDNNDRADVAL